MCQFIRAEENETIHYFSAEFSREKCRAGHYKASPTTHPPAGQGRAGQAALVGEKKMGNGSFPSAALIKKALIIRER
jgi:hypothetical protein